MIILRREAYSEKAKPTYSNSKIKILEWYLNTAINTKQKRYVSNSIDITYIIEVLKFEQKKLLNKNVVI